MKRRSGQILILVLLIVVVALAVGLSVASRNITNIRTSTQTEQSQRAFSAAEGGVEDVLSKLSQVSNDIKTGSNSSGCSVAGGQATCSVPVGTINANVVVASANTYQQVIDEGNVGQIDLTGAAAGTVVEIEWAPGSDSSESSNPASLEITQVNGSSSNYTATRTAWTGGVSGRSESGFSSPNCLSENGFSKCTRVTLNATPVFLRIRPLWNKATVRVSSVSGGSLPAQTYNITSTANTASGITRKVQVTRTALPQLPASFDYVLFSEQDIVK